jgi:hypothetical protein
VADTDTTAARIGPAQRTEASQASERRLDTCRPGRHQQRQSEDEQDQHRQRADRAVGQADAVDHRGERDDREREGRDQPEDDSERAAPPAGTGRSQHGGQDRQHTRGQRGTGPGDECEQDEQNHLAHDG